MRGMLSLGLLLTTTVTLAADKSETEPLLENEAVMAARHTYPPGSESGMHGHDYPFRVVYVLEGGKAELVPEDANRPTQQIEFKEGMTLYVPAATHNVKNVGNKQITLLEIELKP